MVWILFFWLVEMEPHFDALHLSSLILIEWFFEKFRFPPFPTLWLTSKLSKTNFCATATWRKKWTRMFGYRISAGIIKRRDFYFLGDSVFVWLLWEETEKRRDLNNCEIIAPFSLRLLLLLHGRKTFLVYNQTAFAFPRLFFFLFFFPMEVKEHSPYDGKRKKYIFRHVHTGQMKLRKKKKKDR